MRLKGFHMLIGVSKRQPAKCGVCSLTSHRTVITFTKVFQDFQAGGMFLRPP